MVIYNHWLQNAQTWPQKRKKKSWKFTTFWLDKKIKLWFKPNNNPILPDKLKFQLHTSIHAFNYWFTDKMIVFVNQHWWEYTNNASKGPALSHLSNYNSRSLVHPDLCVCYACCFAAPWTVANQAPLSKEFSRQGYWSGLPFPTPWDLSNPGIKPVSLATPALAGRSFTTMPPGKPSCCSRAL